MALATAVAADRPNKDSPVLLRSTLIYAPAIFLTRISALLLLVIATRLLDQTEYGLLALVATIGEMTDMAVTNWLRIAFIRLGGKGAITKGSLRLAARTLALTTVLALSISTAVSIAVVPERWQEFSLAVGAYLVAGSVTRFALCVLQMQQRHSVYSLLELLRAALGILLPALALLLIGGSFFVATLASSLGAVIAGGVGLALALARVVPGAPRFAYRDLLTLGVPLVVMALLAFGINSLERLILKFFYDASAVAIYAAAYALARQPIDVIANAINMGAFPEMVSRFDEHGPDAARKFLGQQLALMARLSLPAAALLLVLSTDITYLVLPASYHDEVVMLFPLIVLSVLLANFQAFVYDNIFHAHKRNWLLIWSSVPGSIVGVALGFLLIPRYEGLGAAYALAGGSLVGLIGSIAISSRLMRPQVPYQDLLVSAAVAVLCGGAAAAVGTALGETWVVVRLAVSALAGGAVFLGLTASVHPRETRRFLEIAIGRLGISGRQPGVSGN